MITRIVIFILTLGWASSANVPYELINIDNDTIILVLTVMFSLGVIFFLSSTYKMSLKDSSVTPVVRKDIQFEKFLLKRPYTATLIVEKMLKDSSEINTMTLKYLFDELHNDNILTIYKALSSSEQVQWQYLSKTGSYKATEVEQIKFHIYQLILVSDLSKESIEIEKILNKLVLENTVKVVKFLKNNMFYSAVLMKLLGDDFKEKFYKYLTRNEIINLNNKFLEVSLVDVSKSLNILSAIVEDTFSDEKHMKLVSSLDGLNPQAQESVLKQMVLDNEIDLILDLTKEYVPVSVLSQMAGHELSEQEVKELRNDVKSDHVVRNKCNTLINNWLNNIQIGNYHE